MIKVHVERQRLGMFEHRITLGCFVMGVDENFITPAFDKPYWQYKIVYHENTLGRRVHWGNLDLYHT